MIIKQIFDPRKFTDSVTLRVTSSSYCMSVMLLLLDALHLGRHLLIVCMLCYSSWTLCISGAIFSGVHLQPHGRVVSFLYFEGITLSTNKPITLLSYYAQLSATLSEQLRTPVNSVMRLFFDCPKLRNTRARRR